MEHLYALGVSIIETAQDWFSDNQDFLELVNDISNPHHVTEVLFPIVSVFDSVFASQLILCMSFGGWLNAVLKWWLLEDRPYWWVRETTSYEGSRRPRLRQFRQTCETGPGSPSGHSATAAMLLVLTLMWSEHVMDDRRWNGRWWRYLLYPAVGLLLLAVMVARIFVAAHFPHQCLIGALIGAVVAPALCLYVSDPFVWRFGLHATLPARNTLYWHVVAVAITVAIAALTYYSLVLCGFDPMWTIKLAFRWCETPENIHVSTTPMFALVQSTGYMLGWALSVTPVVAEYRHYTKHRSLIVSAFTTCLIIYGVKIMENNICSANTFRYYLSHFVLAAMRPMLLLRLTPAISMWPFCTDSERVIKTERNGSKRWWPVSKEKVKSN